MSARLLIALYPLGWRRRYGEEMAALLADTGMGPHAAVNLLIGALRAHVRPRSSWSALVSPEERMRNTVGAVALCFGAVVLAGAGYAKQTEHLAFRDAAHVHALLGALRDTVAVMAFAAAVVVAICGAPLLVSALRASWRGRRRDLLWRLALAPAAVAGFAALTLVLLLTQTPGPAHRDLALLWMACGACAGMLCAWTPRLVLERVDVSPRQLRLAARGAVVLAALMAAIALAIGLYAAILLVAAPGVAADAGGPLWRTTAQALFFFLCISVPASVLAGVSARRGYRIARG